MDKALKRFLIILIVIFLISSGLIFEQKIFNLKINDIKKEKKEELEKIKKAAELEKK